MRTILTLTAAILCFAAPTPSFADEAREVQILRNIRATADAITNLRYEIDACLVIPAAALKEDIKRDLRRTDNSCCAQHRARGFFWFYTEEYCSILGRPRIKESREFDIAKSPRALAIFARQLERPTPENLQSSYDGLQYWYRQTLESTNLYSYYVHRRVMNAGGIAQRLACRKCGGVGVVAKKNQQLVALARGLSFQMIELDRASSEVQVEPVPATSTPETYMEAIPEPTADIEPENNPTRVVPSPVLPNAGVPAAPAKGRSILVRPTSTTAK